MTKPMESRAGNLGPISEGRLLAVDAAIARLSSEERNRLIEIMIRMQERSHQTTG
ncbi:MAG: hypothetical protein WD757_00200 [Actinomycetota bacterium]